MCLMGLSPLRRKVRLATRKDGTAYTKEDMFIPWTERANFLDTAPRCVRFFWNRSSEIPLTTYIIYRQR